MSASRPLRRQVFVLTPEEKQAACVLVAALLLGIATKHYREAHPRPPIEPTAQEQKTAKAAHARAKRASTSVQTGASALAPEPGEEE